MSLTSNGVNSIRIMTSPRRRVYSSVANSRPIATLTLAVFDLPCRVQSSGIDQNKLSTQPLFSPTHTASQIRCRALPILAWAVSHDFETPWQHDNSRRVKLMILSPSASSRSTSTSSPSIIHSIVGTLGFPTGPVRTALNQSYRVSLFRPGLQCESQGRSYLC